jgi:hypothetical protein
LSNLPKSEFFSSPLSDPLHCRIEQFVHERLVWLVLPGRHLTEFCQETRRNADRDELLCLTRSRPADTTGVTQLLVGCFRDVAEVNAAIRHMPCALCGRLGAH